MALPPINRPLAPAQPIRPASDAKAAAQKAFFDAALRRAPAAAAASPGLPVAASRSAVQPVATPLRPLPADEPDQPVDHLPRPGSIVNILV
ncbi:MAG: hypothetical protein JO303_15000 [Caulobacteraceae bacterium]|nr:hypothetical protein [Caulobacteraceae bacterium]